MTKKTQPATEEAQSPVIDPPTDDQDGDGSQSIPATAAHFYFVPLDEDHKPFLNAAGDPDSVEICFDPPANATPVEKVAALVRIASTLTAIACSSIGLKPSDVDPRAVQAEFARRGTAASLDPAFRGHLDG